MFELVLTFVAARDDFQRSRFGDSCLVLRNYMWVKNVRKGLNLRCWNLSLSFGLSWLGLNPKAICYFRHTKALCTPLVWTNKCAWALLSGLTLQLLSAPLYNSIIPLIMVLPSVGLLLASPHIFLFAPYCLLHTPCLFLFSFPLFFFNNVLLSFSFNTFNSCR